MSACKTFLDQAWETAFKKKKVETVVDSFFRNFFFYFHLETKFNCTAIQQQEFFSI